MYGKDYYTEDKTAPESFLKALARFDPSLVCAWNSKRGIFEILRPKPAEVLADFRDQGIHEPYDVVLECAHTLSTRVLDQDGIECAMRVPKEPSDWVFHELRERDTWQDGVWKANADFKKGLLTSDQKGREKREAFWEAHNEEGYAALCKDLNVSRDRVPIFVPGTRDWRK